MYRHFCNVLSGHVKYLHKMDDIAGKAYRIETEIMDSLFGYDSDDNKVSSPTLENKADSSCTPPIILSTTYQSISLQPMPFGPGL